MKNSLAVRIRNQADRVDWPLLLFLAGGIYVKLYVKLAAIVVYAIWLFVKRVRWRRPVAPVWFYILTGITGLVVAAAWGSFASKGYAYGTAIGLAQWGAGAAILYLLYIAVRRTNAATLLATAKGFFALNALFTFGQFAGLIIRSRHLFPYWYYDSGLLYGASTGDHLMGVFMNNSLNNAAATLIGALFFISVGARKWAALCVVIVLMCSSNVVMFGMLLLLILIFIFCGRRRLRLDVSLLAVLTVIIFPVLAPQNFGYIRTVILRLTTPSKPFVAAEILEKDTILSGEDSAAFAAKSPSHTLSLKVSDSMYRRMPQELVALREWSARMPKPQWSYLVIEPDALRPAFKRWYGVSPDETLLAHYGKPAKLFAARQTIGFLNTKPVYWVAGAGMGNFSSKLAVKMTGLRWQGFWPDDRIYLSRPFMEYHFYTLSWVFSRKIDEHSVVNIPGSTWLQLAGEYGLIGLGLCLVLYFGWFWKQCNAYKSGRYILLALLGLFWLDYWYEMMTLTVVAEFALLAGIYGFSAERRGVETE